MSIPLPMSLWALMDSYLKAKMEVWKDQFDELAAADVVVAEQFNPEGNPMPFLLIRAIQTELDDADAKFGDGQYHLANIKYPYEFVIMRDYPDPSGVFNAKIFAANAAASWIDELRADPGLGGLQAVNGETVQYFDFTGTELFVRGAGGQAPDEGNYIGTAVVRITVYTEI